MTKTEALEKHRQMWTWIADTIHEKQKIVWKSQYFIGKDEQPYSFCYLCEYARTIKPHTFCRHCPVIWDGDKKNKCVEHEHKQWIRAMCRNDWELAEEIARKIANLPERR